jgi:hypothetical protein
MSRATTKHEDVAEVYRPAVRRFADWLASSVDVECVFDLAATLVKARHEVRDSGNVCSQRALNAAAAAVSQLHEVATLRDRLFAKSVEGFTPARLTATPSHQPDRVDAVAAMKRCRDAAREMPGGDSRFDHAVRELVGSFDRHVRELGGPNAHEVRGMGLLEIARFHGPGLMSYWWEEMELAWEALDRERFRAAAAEFASEFADVAWGLVPFDDERAAT